MAAVYQPLNQELDEFRLLTIKKGNTDSAISCSLVNVPLGDYSKHDEGIYKWSDGTIHSPNWQPDASNKCVIRWVPEYEALSYAWGDPNIRQPISVNGKMMRVTSNLYSALRTLRKADEDRVFWVDALCINQDDVQERSKQVQRILAIYKRAKQTIMWLGDANRSSDRAIDLLEKLGGSAEQFDSFTWPEPVVE